MRERLGRVRAISEIADSVLNIDIEAVDPPGLRFLPGQFVSIAVAAGQRRSFSIASQPSRKDGFDLIVKPFGAGATAAFINSLEPGHQVRFYGPMGYFVYERGAAKQVIFAATGVGISAIWPMLLAAIEDPVPQTLKLFWGNRNHEDVFWRERLQELSGRDSRFGYEICVSRTGDGHITPHVIATAPSAPVYYLCGNGLMISAISAGLAEAGVTPAAIRTEAFYG